MTKTNLASGALIVLGGLIAVVSYQARTNGSQVVSATKRRTPESIQASKERRLVQQEIGRLISKKDWLGVERLALSHRGKSKYVTRVFERPLAVSALHLKDYSQARKQLRAFLFGDDSVKVRTGGAVLEHAWLFKLASLGGDVAEQEEAYNGVVRDQLKIPGTNTVLEIEKFSKNRDAKVALYLAAHYWGLLDEDHALFYLKQAQALDPSAKVPSLETWRLPILESQGKPHPDGALPRIPFVRNPVDLFSKKRKALLDVPDLSGTTNR